MTAISQKAVMKALARERLIYFLMLVFEHLHPGEPPLRPAWYLKAMCWVLEKVGRGEMPRVMIWLMPRTLKSITAAIAFPCWLLGRNPGMRIMIVTYAERLSGDHADNRRQVLESDWYADLFPQTVITISRQHLLKTARNGHVLAVSVLGTITGRGADIIIMDDCMRAGDQDSEAARETVKNWFTNTLTTRLNDKRAGAIVSIQQRLHEDDLPAFMLERGFECLKLPARADQDQLIETGPGETHLFKRGDLLDPERFDDAVLERERLQLGPRHYSAQYLQDPVAPEGNAVRMDHFRRYERPIDHLRFKKIVQSWDTAASIEPGSAFSVCLTFGYLAGRFFLLDIFRQRVEFPVLRNMVVALDDKWKPDHILIEQASSGIGLLQELRRIGFKRVISWLPADGKVDRYIAQSGQVEEGRVWLPAQLDGLDTLLSELRAFPNGRYCDQVDALVQVLEFANFRWQVLEQTYSDTGRPERIFRGNRPALPLLPNDIK